MTKKSLQACGWIIVISTNLYFVYHFPFTHFNLSFLDEPYGTVLIIHIICGLIAILAGPFQFFSVIRKKYPRVHRLTGRLYLISVLIGAVTAGIMAIGHNIIEQKRYVYGTGLLGLGIAWFITSAMAFWAIRSRNFPQHREWMVKSFVVTCGFTTFRLIAISLNSYIQLDYMKDMSGIMAWASWSVPLLIAEVWLQAQKIRQPAVAAKSISL